jgi:Icc-related predicted phosphoesterase
MRILAFSDIHANVGFIRRFETLIKSQDVELAVCAGDLSLFGRGLRQMLQALNALSVPVILIHGNHESAESVQNLLNEFSNIQFIHEDAYTYKHLTFIGFGGGGFEERDPAFKRFTKKHADKKNVVLLTHQPPHGTDLDELDDWHVGNKDITEFILTYKPVLAISGHIHENAQKKQVFHATVLINPGPMGQVIEL